jgi:hypothetical protein
VTNCSKPIKRFPLIATFIKDYSAQAGGVVQVVEPLPRSVRPRVETPVLSKKERKKTEKERLWVLKHIIYHINSASRYINK